MRIFEFVNSLICEYVCVSAVYFPGLFCCVACGVGEAERDAVGAFAQVARVDAQRRCLAVEFCHLPFAVDVAAIADDACQVVADFDCYTVAFQCLVVAEIELKDENETFPIPPFIGEEVTGNVAYYNSTLAGV